MNEENDLSFLSERTLKFLKTHSKNNDDSLISVLRKESKLIVDKDIDNLVFRSCWNCNTAHNHLKDVEDKVFVCLSCSHYFFKGVDITITDKEIEEI